MGTRPLVGRIAVLFAVALIGCPGPPDVEAPDEPGSWSVGHVTASLEDVGEPDRDVPLDVWYPVAPGDESGHWPTEYPLQALIDLPSDVAVEEAPSADIGAPLLVFSHGYQSINIQSTRLCETLASHGFVVVAPGHTGNTQDADEDDFPTAASRRVPDVAAVIDWVRAGADAGADGDLLANAVDDTRIGVLGHSFGGMTSLGAGAGWAGAAPLDVDALMPISAVVDAELQEDERPYEEAGFTPEQLATVRQPVLLLGGTEDTNVPVENNGLAFDWLTSSDHVVRVDIEGANHTHFANVCDIGDLLIELGFETDVWETLGAGELLAPYRSTCGPEAFPIGEAVRLQNLHAVAFFRLHLMEEAGYGWFLTRRAARDEDAITLQAR